MSGDLSRFHPAVAAFSAARPGRATSGRIYLQVRDWLARFISERSCAEDTLPSERLLAESLGISRGTARKAIAALVDEGLVVRRHGSGNYILPRLEQTLTRLTGFSEELRQRGLVARSYWLGRFVGAATSEETLALGLSPSARVARLERVRLADGTAIAYETSALPTSVMARPQEVADSLYAYLAEHGAMPVRALQHVRATNATTRQAELLAIPLRQALLLITRVGYLADGRAVELTQTWCRSEYYDFVAELARSPMSSSPASTTRANSART